MSSRSESASQCFMFRNTHSNARLLQSRSRGGSRIPGAHQYQCHRHWFHRRGGRVYRNADSSPETTLALGALREPRYSPRRSHRSRTDRHSRKIVRRRRGGFCHELNSAFAWLLRELGFDVTFLSAEVARPGGEFDLPFGHMALRVDIDGRSWLADVGFGECFIQPLRLLPDRAADQRNYRVTRHGKTWHLEKDDAAIYRFTLEPRCLADFERACHHHQDVIRIPLYSESRYDARHAQRTRTPDSRAMHRPRERQA